MTHEQRLTPATLEGIRERAEKATEGPWTHVNCVVCTSDGGIEMADTSCGENPYEDADFIANAREDIPALLVEVERLKTGWALLEFEISQIREFYDRNPSAEREVHVVDEVITKISEVKSTDIVVTLDAR